MNTPRPFRHASRMAAVWLVLVVTVSAETLTIATYNVQNYTLADRQVDGVYHPSYPKPETEKTAVRTVIKALDADVLALQEMGGEAYLKELQRDLAKEGVEYPFAAILEGADADRKLAVLSRRELKQVVAHVDLKVKYFDTFVPVRRGLLEVRVKTGAGELALFVVHLKSRYAERPDDPMAALLRAGEAVAVRDRILTLFPTPAKTQARFVVLGDFNDANGSRPLRAILARGETPIAAWVPAFDSRGHGWTHFYKKEETYTRVDHVLVSPALLPAVRGGAGLIYDGPATAAASDHRPVVVTLELE